MVHLNTFFKASTLALMTLPALSFADGHGNHTHDHSPSKVGIVLGVDVLNYSEELDGVEIDVNTLVVSAGLKYAINNNFSILPEAFLGTGISTDSTAIDGLIVESEIEQIYGAKIKAVYAFNEDVYAFVGPSYVKGKFTSSADIGGGAKITVEGTEGEFGVLAGVGYNFNEKWGAQFSYTDLRGDADTTYAGFGLRFNLPK